MSFVDPQTIHNPSAGANSAPATWFQAVVDDLQFLATGLCARARRTTNFSHNASGTWMKIGLDAERFDTGAIHDNVTNNTRFTAPRAGIWMFASHLLYTDPNGGTVRKTGFAINGAASYHGVSAQQWTNTTGGRYIHSFADLALAANDYVELFFYQDTGATVTVTNVEMWALWVSL